MTRKNNKRIGYVLRRFPVLSETFILNEILEIERRGGWVEIYSLLPPRDPRFHGGLFSLRASIRYVPNMSDLKSLYRYNRRASATFGARYRRLLFRSLLSFNPTRVWRFFQAAYVAQRAHERRVDHLHAHFANQATNVAEMASELLEIPFSFTAHAVDIFKNTVRRPDLARKLRSADFAVAISESNKAFLTDVANGSDVEIEQIYNGIDLNKFHQAESEKVDRPVVFLTVARFVEKKGLDILINACGELHREGHEFSCNIIGKGMLRGRLKALIESNNLQGKVKLLGVHTQDEILARYHQSDVFVLPCLVAADGNRDGLPVSIVEALATSLPVISTDVTGIPEVVRDGQNGLLVRQGNVADLASAMRRLIIEPKLRVRLAKAARPSVVDRFDITKCVAQLNDKFQRNRM